MKYLNVHDIRQAWVQVLCTIYTVLWLTFENQNYIYRVCKFKKHFLMLYNSLNIIYIQTFNNRNGYLRNQKLFSFQKCATLGKKLKATLTTGHVFYLRKPNISMKSKNNTKMMMEKNKGGEGIYHKTSRPSLILCSGLKLPLPLCAPPLMKQTNNMLIQVFYLNHLSEKKQETFYKV